MRLWTLHPKYLDPQGIVTLWREALLARAVLRGETRGYKSHPQLDRFRLQTEPLTAINIYLEAVFDEAMSRGYSFDPSKVRRAQNVIQIVVTSGQVEFEWSHLLSKLLARSPMIYETLHGVVDPEPHPLFFIIPGEIEAWERGQKSGR